MNYQTALKILKLSDSPTPLELKKQFRALALRFHPDRNPGKPQVLAYFQECTEAYNYLLEHMDEWAPLAATESQKEKVRAVVEDLDDIFNDIFGFTREDRILGIQPPQDLELSLAELAFGSQKKGRLIAFEKCPRCQGSGARLGTHAVICTYCFGAGRIRVRLADQTHFKPCPKCEGRGRGLIHPCPICDGFGRVKKLRKQSVQLPVGLTLGEVYTLHSLDLKSGKKYDLFIRPLLKNNSLFAVDKSHILCQYPVSFKEAQEGAALSIPTLWGYASLTIPPESQEGEVFCLKGYGLYVNSLKKEKGDVKILLEITSSRRALKGAKRLLKIISEGNHFYKKHVPFWKKIFGAS